jgi:hypothetical protein
LSSATSEALYCTTPLAFSPITAIFIRSWSSSDGAPSMAAKASIWQRRSRLPDRSGQAMTRARKQSS